MYPVPDPKKWPNLYDEVRDCTWRFQTSKCNQIVATVEFLDTEQGDVVEIVDKTTNRVLGSLSGRSNESPSFPKQYVSCYNEMTIRFITNRNGKRGEGFKISYTADST